MEGSFLIFEFSELCYWSSFHLMSLVKTNSWCLFFSASTKRSFTPCWQRDVTLWAIVSFKVWTDLFSPTQNHLFHFTDYLSFVPSLPFTLLFFSSGFCSGDDEGEQVQNHPMEVCGIFGAAQGGPRPLSWYDLQRQPVWSGDGPHALQTGTTHIMSQNSSSFCCLCCNFIFLLWCISK